MCFTVRTAASFTAKLSSRFLLNANSEACFFIEENAMNHTADIVHGQDCVEACSHCHQICLQTAMNHCLKAGGKHIEADHFRLIMNCAEICQTSANFQLSSSHFQHRLCEVCAEICEACATDCEKIGGMDECVKACRACAESCRQMASIQH